MSRNYASVTNGGTSTITIPGFVIRAGKTAYLTRKEYIRLSSRMDLSAVQDLTVTFLVELDASKIPSSQATDVEVAEAIAAVNLGEIEPVDGAQAVATIAAADLAIVQDDIDYVFFNGIMYPKVDTGATGNQFEDATGLAALIDDEDDWSAVEDAGAVVITAEAYGAANNDETATLLLLADTTAGGDAENPAIATISAAQFAQIAEGNSVEFLGETFTMVGGFAPDAGEFTNQTDLISLFDALDGWGAANSGGDTVITASSNGAEGNDENVMLSLYRSAEGGADVAPEASVGAFGFNVTGDEMYIRHDEQTWKKATLAGL